MSPTRRRLALRVYGFVAALSIVTMVALIALPRFSRTARYLEPQAALMQYMVERWSLQEPAKFAEAMARVETRLRGKLTIFTADGALVHSTTRPPLPGPTADEAVTLGAARWALSTGRIVGDSTPRPPIFTAVSSPLRTSA